MGSGGSRKPKTPPPAAPPPTAQATNTSEAVREASEAEKKRLRRMYGQQNTILTGGLGTDAVTDKKKLLG